MNGYDSCYNSVILSTTNSKKPTGDSSGDRSYEVGDS